MHKFARWVGRNIDGIVALAVALAIVTLDVASNLDGDTVNNGILLVLGVLTVAMLRDRAQRDDDDHEMRRTLEETSRLEPSVAAVRTELESVTKALKDSSMVQVLGAAEIYRALAAARADTDRWLFRGGTGTYIRAQTLKGCVESARRRRSSLLVRLEIVDPTNERVCETYGRFRRSLAVQQDDWTTERTRHESYATILAAAWHRQRYELLDIEVALSQQMPTLRWDLSSQMLLITHEGPQGLALKVDAGRLLYDYTQTELRTSFDQAIRVKLDLARDVRLSDEVTPDEAARLFGTLNMPLPTSYLKDDVEDIIRRALHAEDPYPR